MAIDIFGFSFGKKKKEISSLIPDKNEDGALVVDAFGAQSFAPNFHSSAKNEHQLIEQYREMALLHEVDFAIDDIINEAIVTTENKAPIEVNLEEIELPDSIKNKIKKEFNNILNMLKFERNGHEIMKRWYIDGRAYYHKVIDENNKKKGIQKLIHVDSLDVKKVRVEKKERDKISGVERVVSVEEFFLHTPRNSFGQQRTPIKIHPDSMTYAHSGILDQKRSIILGYLHKAIKPMNQLNAIEDSTVIYRLARAAEKRVFYIDVGSLPKNKAEQYINGIITKYKNKVVYDSSTGDVKDKRHHQAMVEDYYLPRREGGRGTEISTLESGQNLGELSDVEYFRRKFYRSLNVPTTRIETENTFNLGRASEITRDELKFGKWVGRLRNKFSELFLDFLRTQLILKNIISDSDWEKIKEFVRFDYVSDSQFVELKETELMRERMEILQGVDDFVGKYFSKKWVRKNVLRQSDDMIKEIDKQIEEEDKAEEIRKFDPEVDQPPAIEPGGFPPEGEQPGPPPEDTERKPPPPEENGREDGEK